MEIKHYVDEQGVNHDPIFAVVDANPDFELGWYFEDETRTDTHGPFGTFEECVSNLNRYASQL